MNTIDGLLFDMWGRRFFLGNGAEFFFSLLKRQPRCPHPVELESRVVHAAHKQKLMHCFFESSIINFKKITPEMGLPLQIFKEYNGGAWRVSHWLVWHPYILLLTQQYFIVKENPSVSAHSGDRRRGEPPLWCIPWVFRGNVTPFLPRVKETFGIWLKETVLPQVLSCLVNSEKTTGCVLWTFGIAVPTVIWLVLSQMDHFEGKFWLSPLIPLR